MAEQTRVPSGAGRSSLEPPMTRRGRVLLMLLLPACHLVAGFVVQTELLGPSEGSWTWFPMFLADLPFSFLLLMAGNLFPGWDVAPFLLYGVAGTAWWFFLSWALASLARQAFRKQPE
jgi:hypothetical protein